MLLTGPAIRAAIASGDITIIPLGPDQVDQAGVTLHLHPRLLECWTKKAAKAEGLKNTEVAPLDVRVDDGGRFYLGATVERIYAPHHVVRVDGKSSPGRKSLEVHRTAGHVEPGFGGQITLEMSVLVPLLIPPGWPVCQAVFHEVTGLVESYDRRGHYADANGAEGPQTSRSHMHKPRHVKPTP